MDYQPKIYSAVLTLVFVAPVIGLLSYNIYIDPFQIFHKDFEKPTVLLSGRGTDRYQHAGIINQYDINAIIIGHSHVANYLPSKVSEEFGIENVYTLTMDGAPIHEQKQTAKYALDNHNISWVLWGFSTRNLVQNPKAYNKKLPLNLSLYDNSRINDLNFFLTLSLKKYHNLKQKKKEIIRNSKNKATLIQKEFDLATAWFPRTECSFNRPEFIASKIYKSKKIKYDKNTIKSLKPLSKKQLNRKLSARALRHYKGNLKNNILPLIIENPSTQFHFIISVFPTAAEQNIKLHSQKRYLDTLLVLRAFVEDMSAHSNVKIFNYGLEKFSNDLRLFKDQGHFHKQVNDYFLEKMANNEGQLTTNNIDEYLRLFDKKVSNYRLPEKWNTLKPKKTTGYLSDDIARKLIISNKTFKDDFVSEQSLNQKKLPACAKKLKKNNAIY